MPVPEPEKSSDIPVDGDIVHGNKVEGDMAGGDRIEGDIEIEVSDHSAVSLTGDAIVGPVTKIHAEQVTVYTGETTAEEEEALRAYLGTAARFGNRLPLAPLDPSGQESAYISLAQIFVGLDAGPGFEVSEDPDTSLGYTAALGHIHKNERLILLGDPGAGKSTLLRFLTLCLAQAALAPDEDWLYRLSWSQRRLKAEEQRKTATALFSGPRLIRLLREKMEEETIQIQWTTEAPVPIFVTLRDLARDGFDPDSPTALWGHVAGRLEREDMADAVKPLRRLAQAGGIIFLLDGVDEVPLEQRPAVWRAIANLREGPYGGNRWLATCRILSFAEGDAPPGVPVQTLSPLDENQVNDFIKGWYRALAEAGEMDRDQAVNMTSDLQAAAQRPRLWPLAQNPMLLTIMALVQTYHGTLPDERAKLYQACVETLLLRWQRHKEKTSGGSLLPEPLVKINLDQVSLERLLWEIAWTAHSGAAAQEKAADIPEEQVMAIARRQLGSYAKAEAFLEYTERRAHLLIGRGGAEERVYAFPHRTFQEYLAACHLASGRRFPQEAARLAQEPGLWREGLNLAAGTLVFNQNNREKALDGVAGVLPKAIPEMDDEAGWNRVWMAGEMMVVVGREAAEADEVGRELLPRLRERLVALLAGGRLSPRQRSAAGDALSQIGDPRQGVSWVAREGLRIPDIAWGEIVPAGDYTIGGDKEAYRSFKRRKVTIERAFQLARYPITYAQFQCFVDAGDFADRQWWRGMPAEEEASGERYRLRELSEQWFKFWNHPREMVSWYQAIAFCRWLSHKLGDEIDLPHEYEWEVAARYPDGRFYPWGNSFERDWANIGDDGLYQTSAVGLYPQGANKALDLYDLSGNVWEWCRNKFEDPDDTAVDQSGDRRVVRGGSWYDDSYTARAASRSDNHPYTPDPLGFRVVRRPPSHT